MEPTFTKGGNRAYTVDADFDWPIGKVGSPWVLTVPAGFEFESSVPLLLRWVLSPNDPRFLKAAAIHDYLLEHGYSRPFSDAEWLDAARSVHAPRLKRELAFITIRSRGLFGR